VDAIEPLLPFWVDRLGFEKTVEVPDEGRLGFAILQQGSAEVMLQTHASAGKDPSRLSKSRTSKTCGAGSQAPKCSYRNVLLSTECGKS
jgi:hypothetical protein